MPWKNMSNVKALLGRIRHLLRGDLLKSSFYSGIATLIKVATAFCMSKIVAVYLGPEGLGLIGQLSNFVMIMLVVAGGAINSGIVKYVAEYEMSHPEKVKAVLSTGFRLVLILGGVAALGILVLCRWLSVEVLMDSQFVDVFIVFAFTIIFYGLNTFLISIINGYKQYAKFNLINSVTNIIGLVISFLFIRIWGVKGALIATVTNQSIIFFFTLFFVRNESWFKKENFVGSYSKEQMNNLLQYILMTVVSTICLPVSQIAIRSFMIQDLSLAQAGIWEVVNRISTIYLMFVTTSLSTYYLPRLSELKDNQQVREEIMQAFKIIIPVVVVSCLLIYVCRFWIIKTLFSGAFYEASGLFAFQLIGDVLKIMAWLIAFQMLAKRMTTMYVITEIVFALSSYLLSIFFIKRFGLPGATYAFALNYLLYLITLVILFRKVLFTNAKAGV